MSFYFQVKLNRWPSALSLSLCSVWRMEIKSEREHLWSLQVVKCVKLVISNVVTQFVLHAQIICYTQNSFVINILPYQCCCPSWDRRHLGGCCGRPCPPLSSGDQLTYIRGPSLSRTTTLRHTTERKELTSSSHLLQQGGRNKNKFPPRTSPSI